MPDDYWNHNTHYQRLVLDAAPPGCREALDVGCGDGRLVRALAGRSRRVTGIDLDEGMVRLARAAADEAGLPNADFVVGDFLSDAGLEPGRYDLVSAVAVVHHPGFAVAVPRLAELVAPGGRLVVVGLALDRSPWDRAAALAGLAASHCYRRRHGGKSDPVGMPMAAADLSWGEVRREARRLLPGARYRRRLLWRYSVEWQRPSAVRGAGHTP